MSQTPNSVRNFTSSCLPFDWESTIDETQTSEENVIKVTNSIKCSREKAILGLNKCNNDPVYAIMYLSNRDAELKFDIGEKKIISIIAIPTMEETNIWSTNGRPVILSNEAKSFYEVSSLEEMPGKEVFVFRRFKLPNGEYEMPEKYHCRKATFVEIINTSRLDIATAKIETDGVEEDVNLKRVCILV